MLGFLRKWVGRNRTAEPQSSAQKSAVGDPQAQSAQEHLRDPNYRHPHSQSDTNFEKKFDASDEDLSRVRELNESNLYSDGSSEYSRIQARRQDGGDTESLSYPQTRNLRGKGAQPPQQKKRRKHRKAAGA
ncbi:MAG: hypothetical protein ACJ763_05090 [Bdellovibrionia bacterium]